MNSAQSLIIVFFFIPFLCAATFQEPLINTRAKEWKVKDWINSKPIQLKDLKGKVVLIRWWTAAHCPFCLNSAPALKEFYEKYHQKGLEVIGMYHHKSSDPFTKDDVQKHTDDFGFAFPVAIDYQWKTLRKWWLDTRDRGWTSVTFLIDRKGIIRHIHPGGQYVKGDEDYKELKEKIELLLDEHL